MAFDTTGNVRVFVGTEDTLFVLEGNETWRDCSNANGYATAKNWSFEVFQHRVIATNGIDPPQHYALPGASNSRFEDVPGAPVARYVGSVRNFLVLANLATDPNAIHWSGFGNYATWEPNKRTQADFQDLSSEAGRIQAIVSGDLGLIFQDFSLTEMVYTGPPTIFELTERERERGTPAPRSVVWYGHRVYFYAHDGFYYYDFASRSSEPIGQDRVDAWFERMCPRNRLESVQGALDVRRGLVMWAFPEHEESALNDLILVYNWIVDRWSIIRIRTSYIAQSAGVGVTLEELDTEDEYRVAGTASIDVAGALSLDSDVWRGGALNFIGFNADHRAGTFTGAPLQARLTSRETVGQDNSLRYVNAVRPLVDPIDGQSLDPSSIRLDIGVRDETTERPRYIYSEQGGLPLNRIGEANPRARNRFQRYTVTINDGFEHAHGLLLQIKRQAGRKALV